MESLNCGECRISDVCTPAPPAWPDERGNATATSVWPIYFVKRNESQFVRFHAAQCLNLVLTTFVYVLGGVAVVLATMFGAAFVARSGQDATAVAAAVVGVVAIIAVLALLALAIIQLVYLVMSIVRSSRFEMYRMPKWICWPMIK